MRLNRLNPLEAILIFSLRFYLPHGISVDLVGNLWLTDVALHQVFRYRNDNLEQPDLILGERFVPGNDAGHFCQPTVGLSLLNYIALTILLE